MVNMADRTKLALPAALALALGASAAHGAAGDWLIRGGIAHVNPDVDSGALSSDPAAFVDVDSDTSLGITFTYMVTHNVGVELLGAVPFEHDVKGRGSLDGTGTIASTKHLPPTLTLQYHFAPEATIRPYAGLGLNYTHFFDEETKGALDGTPISLDNSWGLSASAGVDIDVGNNWFVNGSVWWIDIDTEADLTGVGTIDVEIDPWVFMVGVGTRF